MRRKLIPYNLNLTPVCPLSCRWRSGWHPCHPSLTNGGIHDRRFHFCTLLTDQRHGGSFAAGNVRNCANHAAAMVMVPELEAILSPPVQNSFSATAPSSNRATRVYRTVRTINVPRRVLVSPDDAHQLRSSRFQNRILRWLAPSHSPDLRLRLSVLTDVHVEKVLLPRHSLHR